MSMWEYTHDHNIIVKDEWVRDSWGYYNIVGPRSRSGGDTEYCFWDMNIKRMDG